MTNRTTHNLLGTIIETTYTQVDLHRRLRLLRMYLESVYFSENHTGKKLETFLKTNDATKGDIVAILKWLEELESHFTESNFYEEIESLLKESESIAVITVYLPFNPEEEEKAKICIWLREELQKNVFIDLKLDQTLLGGCALVVDGKYGNFSLRKRITDKKTMIQDTITKKMVA